eukprot:CAMPEP_0184485660 /NCGR_PEP_ID=MMETSP0113_2-20130426/7239_1 /TAXON_ID=91329 /ORGANISM="Norrisiella sphaerica, Strain BC52" /LENGTH=270 /DNA_ID=CAMNT_0026867201 /DNA_START=233 /DNA_END=1045 /DNA_ORIENTATION=-
MPQTGKSHINGFRSLLSPHAKLSNRGFSPALNLEKFRNRVTSTQARRAQVLEVEGEWDYWKLSDAVKSVKAGGIVILPTESCYTFIADVNSRDAIQKIYTIKDMKDPLTSKPLSLLCHSISQISEYTTGVQSRSAFKLLKDTLPGPYTFILPASNKLPRLVVEHKEHKKVWRRKEIGVRIPNEPIVIELLKQLDSPVLCSSVPTSRDSKILATDGQHVTEVWSHCVDFIIDAGERNSEPSTVVDMTDEDGSIKIIREGAGKLDALKSYPK